MRLFSSFLIGLIFVARLWGDENHFVFDFETTKVLLQTERTLIEVRGKAVWNPLDIDSANPTPQPNRLQGTLNPLFHYTLSDRITFGGCYVYKGEGVFQEDPIQEHRLCQDLIFRFFFAQSKVSHRLRLEERWISRQAHSQWDYRTRLRYRLTHRQAFRNQSEGTGGLSFNVYDEVFFGVSGSPQMIQANWLHAGLIFEFADEKELEIGTTIETSARPGTTQVQNLILLEFDWSW